MQEIGKRFFNFLKRSVCERSKYTPHVSSDRYGAEKPGEERYCSNCHILVYDNSCPVCGRKGLRQPDAEDYCFLSEFDPVWSGVFEDVLSQNAVPYLTENALGSGLAARMGNMLESVRFYIRYAHYHRGKELEQELFSGVPLDEEEFD